MVLMDSHLFDYQDLDASDQSAVIDKLISEIQLVGGQASIIWHPHTLGSDYGWESAFDMLLDRLGEEKSTKM